MPCALRVLYIQYTNPAALPPLEHSSRLLAEAGGRVVLLGIESFGSGALEFPAHPAIRIQRLRRFSPRGYGAKLTYLLYIAWAAAWTVIWRPQWIYASDPFVCPVAWLLSYWPGVRVVYHEHDHPGPRTGLVRRLIAAFRMRLPRRAALCVLPNEERARLFAQETSQGHPVYVWNCPRREEVAAPRLPVKSTHLRVIYHGSLVPDRLPMSILRALAQSSSRLRLLIVGYNTIGHPDYATQLHKEAQRLGVSEHVEIRKPVPRHQLLRICASCDVGLAFIPKITKDINFQFMTGASNKAFDYLACGLALLVPDLPEWQRMYVEPGFGLACDPGQADTIWDALRWFVDNPDRMRAMGEAGRQRVLQEWNYETQFQPVWQRIYRCD